MEGMSVEDVLKKYPYLRTPAGRDPATPFPTIQLLYDDWKMAIIGRGLNVVKVDVRKIGNQEQGVRWMKLAALFALL
ncbi:hypothetical protein KOW79_020176 [Hemibagrus wyckioides]|uniref:Uncharacterized protein n=1 Tax=Hemibagrus wyckioides TaxID=337641 RepID=A0A9D3N8U7_9TELE|nr:hypothetical protein KOW79_020176 [Hemibagrus wyckioides]